MNKTDRDEQNVKRCPKCGDILAILVDGKPAPCSCQDLPGSPHQNLPKTGYSNR